MPNNIIESQEVQIIIDGKNLPEIIHEQVDKLNDLDVGVKKALAAAEKAGQRAKEAGKLSASFWSISDQKKAAIEGLQKASIELADAVQLEAQAQKLSFDFQTRLADITKYLFSLGASNITNVRTIVRTLKMRLEKASEEEINEFARKELWSVIQQLKEQEDLFQKQERMKEDLSKHGKNIKYLIDQADTQTRELKEAELRIEESNHALRAYIKQDLRDSVEQCLERLNNGFSEQAKLHSLFEQKFVTNFSIQEQQVQKSLEQLMAEGALHKAAVQEQLNAAITTLKEHGEALEKQLNLFEQQVADNFSAQAQEAKKSLNHLMTENALQKTAVQEQLNTAITTLKQHGEMLEQQLNNSFSTQSQHTKTELTRFSNDSSEFKTNIEQQLHAHLQTILEKISIQNSITKQLNDTFSGLEAIQSQQTQAQKASEAQLATLLVNYQKSASGNRLAIAGTAILAIASLGWQVAQYFVLN